jgi:hypothetical protein
MLTARYDLLLGLPYVVAAREFGPAESAIIHPDIETFKSNHRRLNFNIQADTSTI